jgi:transposase
MGYYTGVQPNSQIIQEAFMQFIGVDLHTNKFTCCYRDENSVPDGKKATITFDLSAYGMARFCPTLTEETHVLIEATITTYCFARLIQPLARQAIVANTYELKQISLARKNTDKVDTDILCRILKMQVLSGKQTTQIKDRIHSLLKEKLYGFIQEEIFTQKQQKAIRALEKGSVMPFQINQLFDWLESMESQIESLQDKIMEQAEPFMKEIEILTGMKGICIFIAMLSSSLLTQSMHHVLNASEKLDSWYSQLTE